MNKENCMVGWFIVLVAVTVLSVVAVLASLYPFYWNIVEAQRWTDTTCYTIGAPCSVLQVVNCSCKCECLPNAPVLPVCTNQKSYAGQIRRFDCAFYPCIYHGCFQPDFQPYCQRCTFVQFALRVAFNYTALDRRQYTGEIRDVVYDDKQQAIDWVKQRTGDFPCSYAKGHPEFTPVYGHRYAAAFSVFVGLIVTYGVYIVAWVLAICWCCDFLPTPCALKSKKRCCKRRDEPEYIDLDT